MTQSQPNQYEDTELKANVERYVAALAESGDNFMKPQNVSADLRAQYVSSLMQLIEQEATRRQQALLDELEACLPKVDWSANPFSAEVGKFIARKRQSLNNKEVL